MKYTKEEVSAAMELLPTLWVDKYDVKTETGDLVSFKSHSFLFDIYNDFSPKQVIMKAAQIGFSTMAIIKSMWLAKKRGMDIIYTLPTADDVKEFVGGKVNRIINNNSVLANYVRDHDTIEQKRVGRNMIYFKGTWTERAALMVSSDLNIYDEEDRSKRKVIEQYASRQQASKDKWEWHFSNPSTEGNGVSSYWQDSDQRHWFIKCSSCNKEQYMSFPESIDRERRVYICKSCRVILKEEDRRHGKWIPKYKDRDFVGYWIPLLIAPWIKASEILDYEKTKDSQYFSNFVLGLPYVGPDSKMTENDLFKNLIDEKYVPKSRVVIGVDTGIKLRFVVGDKGGLFYYGECDDYDGIERLMNRYSRSIVVMDQGGDIIGSRKLREKHLGRVFLCHYGRDRKTYQLLRWGEGKEYGNVVADRNRLIQLVIDEFRDERLNLYGTEQDWWDYWLHWSHIYKVSEENNLGVIERKWERSDRDDWVHATCYWRIGMDRFGQGEGDIMGYGARDFLSTGYEVQGQKVSFDPLSDLDEYTTY